MRAAQRNPGVGFGIGGSRLRWISAARRSCSSTAIRSRSSARTRSRDAFRWSHRKAIPATAVEITASLSHSSSLRFP